MAFVGAGLGHSVIGGYEQPMFLGVPVTALAFEGVWRSGAALTLSRPVLSTSADREQVAKLPPVPMMAIAFLVSDRA